MYLDTSTIENEISEHLKFQIYMLPFFICCVDINSRTQTKQ